MFGLDLGNLIAHLTLDTKNYDMALLGVERRLGQTAANLQKIGQSMFRHVTLPLAGIAAASLASFGKFDEAMAKSLAIFGDVSESMRREMEMTARQMSKESVSSSTELAKAYFYLGSAGFNAEQSLKALGAVERFATAGSFDLSTATTLAADAQKALGLAAKDPTQNLQNLTHVTDVLSGANTLANATIHQFSAALTNEAGPAMKVWNISLEEGVAVLAAYADQGIKAEEAGSSFGRMLRLLMQGFMQNRQAWQKFGVDIYDAQRNLRPLADIIEDITVRFSKLSPEAKAIQLALLGFQARSQQVLMPLLGMSDAIRDYNERLLEMKGITNDLAERNLKNFWSQLVITWHHIVDMGKSIGEVLAPKMAALGEKIRSVTEWFDTLSDSTKAGAVELAMYVALIGPAILVIGKLVGALSGLLLLLNAHPFMLAATAIAAVGFAFYKIRDGAGAAAEKARLIKRNLAEVTGEIESMTTAQAELNRAIELGNDALERQAKQSQITALERRSVALRELLIKNRSTAVEKIETLEALLPNKVDVEKYWREALSGINADAIQKIIDNATAAGSRGASFGMLKPYTDAIQKLKESTQFEPVMGGHWYDKNKQQFFDFQELGIDMYGRLTVSAEEFAERAKASLQQAFVLKNIPVKDAIAMLEARIAEMQKNLEWSKDDMKDFSDKTDDAADAADKLSINFEDTKETTADMLADLDKELEALDLINQGYARGADILKFQELAAKEIIDDQDKLNALVEKYKALTLKVEAAQRSIVDGSTQDMLDALREEIAIIDIVNEGYKRGNDLVRFKKLAMQEAASGQSDYNEKLKEYLKLLDELGEKQKYMSFRQWFQDNDMENIWDNLSEDAARGLDSLAETWTTFIEKGTADWKGFTAGILHQWNVTIQKMLIKSVADVGWEILTDAFSSGLKQAVYPAHAMGAVYSQSQLLPMGSGGIIPYPAIIPMANNKAAYVAEEKPEAIMPLQRTPTGELGVRAQQMPVNVDARTKIVNVFDQEEFYAALKTERGEKLIVNAAKRSGII